MHDLIDDMAEQTQIANEISNAISNPVGFQNDIDEDELLKELEELQDEDLENELLNIPNAPSTSLPQTSTKDKQGKVYDIVISLRSLYDIDISSVQKSRRGRRAKADGTMGQFIIFYAYTRQME